MPVRDFSTETPETPESGPPNRRAFWDRHPGLVWSNRNAPDEAFISAALRKGRFLQLLEIAVEFGVARLRRQWEVEKQCGDLTAGMISRTEENLTIMEEAYARSVAARDGANVEEA
ncbi:MAG TPA: hypothetical protein VG796_02460 [Verrucomicrobiales bacterium]|jgi:hypothetical protein|nr:hypothetical protein [Verrucomicrobiales bacterium]